MVAAGAGVAGAPAVAGAGEALEAALSGAAFVRFRQVMLSTDLLTAAGRRKVFEAATEGDCILPIRLLLSGEAGLAKKDSALGALMLGLRPFLSEWFSRVAVLDVIGAVHPWTANIIQSIASNGRSRDSAAARPPSSIRFSNSTSTP